VAQPRVRSWKRRRDVPGSAREFHEALTCGATRRNLLERRAWKIARVLLGLARAMDFHSASLRRYRDIYAEALLFLRGTCREEMPALRRARYPGIRGTLAAPAATPPSFLAERVEPVGRAAGFLSGCINSGIWAIYRRDVGRCLAIRYIQIFLATGM